MQVLTKREPPCESAAGGFLENGMFSTFTVSSCYQCNILMEQNKQLCLELEEAREKQDDSILLAQFAQAVLPASYTAWLDDPEQPSLDKFTFQLILVAEKVLEQYKRRIKQ